MWQDILNDLQTELKDNDDDDKEPATAVTNEYATDDDNLHRRRCIHEDIHMENEKQICMDCGLVIAQNFCINNAYSLSSAATSATTASNTVVARHKMKKCLIMDEMPSEFDPELRNIAVTIYNMISVKRVYRANFRRAIVAACLHRASIYLPNKFITPYTLTSTFNISYQQFERGVSLVAINLAFDEFRIPFLSLTNEITSITEPLNIDSNLLLVTYKRLTNLYPAINIDSHVRFVLIGCAWLYIWFENLPITLDEISKKCGITIVNIRKKFCEIYYNLVRSLFKRWFSWCLTQLFNTQTIAYNNNDNDTIFSSNSDIMILNHANPDNISIVRTKDNFTFPLDDVTNITDWNKFTMETEYGTNRHKLRVKVMVQKKGIVFSYVKCSNANIKRLGNNIWKNEIKAFILSK